MRCASELAPLVWIGAIDLANLASMSPPDLHLLHALHATCAGTPCRGGVSLTCAACKMWHLVTVDGQAGAECIADVSFRSMSPLAYHLRHAQQATD